MTLRETLKKYVPMYLWERINHVEGHIVSNEEYNMRWNLIQAQGDQHSNMIRDILKMLYDTVLNDADGVSHIKVTMPEYASDNLKGVLLAIDQRLKADAQALVNHKTSGDHDGRYYTKAELIPWLRGGDTNRKEEVFIIVNSNNGDGTFTYTANGEPVIGQLTSEGYQVFELREGYYDLGGERIEVFINDTLRRSVKSGGLIEISPTSFALTATEGAGAEVSAIYYERLGMIAEYNIKLSAEKPPQNNGKNMWFKIIG